MGTCRPNARILSELIQMEASDSNYAIPWSNIKPLYTEYRKVCQTAWKDNAVVLTMSNVLDGKEVLNRPRKRPEETSSKARNARIFVETNSEKELEIPLL